ncbi:predicted protein [Naegleria gruberi]|uniref:Predicted protein n=1 Tax=Naegleria gruberi TaxID=5762 RepID=D2VCQ1_NAEGR|nr:uncharacterized protein NAEGRDRAFT_57811 [Naegleria gruberi]EFC45346.1 predicted protein [Naegleria gruberi]|eukprot:XP_002678090.1 predicted protein [Naegleria gruberi strain NEG-M]
MRRIPRTPSSSSNNNQHNLPVIVIDDSTDEDTSILLPETPPRRVVEQQQRQRENLPIAVSDDETTLNPFSPGGSPLYAPSSPQLPLNSLDWSDSEDSSEYESSSDEDETPNHNNIDDFLDRLTREEERERVTTHQTHPPVVQYPSVVNSNNNYNNYNYLQSRLINNTNSNNNINLTLPFVNNNNNSSNNSSNSSSSNNNSNRNLLHQHRLQSTSAIAARIPIQASRRFITPTTSSTNRNTPFASASNHANHHHHQHLFTNRNNIIGIQRNNDHHDTPFERMVEEHILAQVIARTQRHQIIFLQYWNQYLEAKTKMNPFEFFEKYSQNGIPDWMFNITYYENIMCYSVTFGIVIIYIFSIVLYFTHMTKFMLDRIITKKKMTLKDSLDRIKEKGAKTVMSNQPQPTTTVQSTNDITLVPKSVEIELVENDPAISVTLNTIENSTIGDKRYPTLTVENSIEIDKNLVAPESTGQLTTMTNDTSLTTSQQQGGGSTNIHISFSDDTEDDLTSSAITDADEIFLTDVDTFGTEDKENGLATEGYENFTENTKALKVMQFIEEKKVIQIVFSVGLFLIWFIIAALLLLFWKQAGQFVSLFPVFETIQGVCTSEKRSTIGTFCLLFGLLFPIVFVFVYSLDIYQSISEYRIQKDTIKRNSRQENMPNFFIYYFIDTDLFLYRLECSLLFLFGALSVCLYVIFWDPSGDDKIKGLISHLISLFGIEFFMIVIMPGISIFATIYRTWKEKKLLNKQDENLDQMTVLNLKRFAPGIECIDFILTHPIERQLFYKYLTSEFSQENLLFMEDIMRFQRIPPQKLRYKIMKLREIITLYLIQNSSVFEVNISKKLIDSEIQSYILIEHILHHHSIKMINLPKFIKETPKINSFPEPLQQNDTDRELLLNAFKEINHPDFMKGIITEAYSNLLDSYLRFISSRVWLIHLEKVKQFGIL